MKCTRFQAQGHFIRSSATLLNKFDLHLFWKNNSAWSLVYQVFISCWKHNFPLETASLLSICRVIAESFLFTSLKSIEFRNTRSDWDTRQDMTKRCYAKSLFFFQICGQSNKGIASSYKSYDSMLLFLLRSYWKLSAITLKIANNEVICKMKLYLQ